MPKGYFVLYLKERKLVSMMCVYNLFQVKYLSFEVRTIQSFLVVKGFPKDFPNDLLGVSPKR